MKHALLCISWLLMFFSAATAQQRAISGKVTGSDGTPIPFATVQVKGTSQGTAADQSGNFKVNIDGNNTVLVVRSVGFLNADFQVGSQSQVTIVLQQDKTNLQEVVVTGLGIKREKKALGYAVQDVKGDDLIKANQSDALGALSGKVAGVQVTSSGGTPGSATYIKLRGSNSITGNNQPLFVIDGIPIDNSQSTSGDPSDGKNSELQGSTNTNRGADINPNDIESISVLKGPAAAAIYGIEAANGAVIITTKKGVAGKPTVDFNTSWSVDFVNKLPPIQKTWVKGQGGQLAPFSSTNRYSWGANKDTLFWTGVPNEYDPHGDIVGKSDPSAKIPFVPYNNLKDFWRTGLTANNSLSISGGSENATYRIGVSNLHQNSIVPTQSYDRTNVSLAGSVKVSPKFKFAGSINYSTDGGNMPQNGSNLSGIMLGLTRTPISFPNNYGSLASDDPANYLFSNGLQRSYRNGIYDNPFWTINKNPYTTSVNRLIGSVQADYQILKELSFTYRIGTDVYQDNRHQLYDIQSGAYPGGRIFDDRYTFKSVNSDAFLNYTHRFTPKLRLDARLGNNYYSRKMDELYTQGDGLTAPNYDNIYNATAIKSANFITPYRKASGFYDVNLDFNSMLFLEIIGREDWTSTLPKTSNNFFYPAFNLGFVFTELNGLKGNDVLTFGKLRASVAQVGKDPGTFNTTGYFVPTTFPDGFTSGISFPYGGIGTFSKVITLGNPDLKPERTTSYEAGLQLQFWGNRLGLDATYYHTKGTNLIVQSPIAASSGYQYVTRNSGSIQNNGVEVALNGTPVKGRNFTWDVLVNFSLNRNKVLELGKGIDQITLNGFTGSVIANLPGQPAGIIYGYGFLRDGNGNVVIDDNPNGTPGYPVVSNVQTKLGDPNPKFLLGLGNTFTYKNLSLYFLVDWKQKGQMWNGTRGSLMAIGTSAFTENRGQMTTFKGVLGHFDEQGNLVHQDGGAEKPGVGGANTAAVPLDENWYLGNGGGFGGQSETFIDDASYVKLREITLSYSLNANMFASSKFVKGVSFSAFARNIILWTPYKGVDPETSLTGATSAQGLDYFNMPGTSSVGLSARVKF